MTETPSAPAAITASALSAVMPAMPQAGKLPMRRRNTWITRRKPSSPIGVLPLALEVVP